MGRINSDLTGHEGVLVFEDGRPVPCAMADRGELSEVEQLLKDEGYGNYIADRVAAGVRGRSVELTRAALLEVIFPKGRTSMALQAVIVGYAMSVPGMPPMKDAGRMFGLGPIGKAAISKRVVAYVEKYDLPPSIYMKSAKARRTYSQTNQIKRGQ